MTTRWYLMIVPVALIISACSPKVGQSKSEDEAPATGSLLVTETAPNTPIPIPKFDDTHPLGAEREFSTDFTKHSIDYSEILSGGPPKDGIPSIDEPKFISVPEAAMWLSDVEPVIYVQVGDDARAYPIQILIWHEIVNDTVGDLPLTITFCPLCNTAIVFEREVNGLLLDFGTTGRLRNSNLIMYDRQTETWWQQGIGEAIVGELLGENLDFYPASIIAWGDFSANFPEGKVLSKDTGFDRSYGQNPYVGYDDINNSPFLYQGITPDELRPMERVLALELNGETVAYPYSILEDLRVVNDVAGGDSLVVFWVPGTTSALNTSNIPDGRDVGSASAFSSILEGEKLTFSEHADGLFMDDRTGSLWNIFGLAVEGISKGKKLIPLTAVNHFWFDWVAFKPDTMVYTGE